MKWGECLLFNKVNFIVKVGEFIVIVGENGCGKFILFSIICGGEGVFCVLVSGKIYVYDMLLEYYSV